MSTYHVVREYYITIEYFGGHDLFNIELNDPSGHEYAMVLSSPEWKTLVICVEKMNEILMGKERPDAEQVPNLSSAKSDLKEDIINTLVEVTAKNVLSTFVALGLKSHIDVKVVNDVDGSEYQLLFTKIN